MKGELATCSIDFSLRIVSFYKWLTEVKHEYVMARQILRSGTSIGANIHEAEYAISKTDFITNNNASGSATINLGQMGGTNGNMYLMYN